MSLIKREHRRRFSHGIAQALAEIRCANWPPGAKSVLSVQPNAVLLMIPLRLVQVLTMGTLQEASTLGTPLLDAWALVYVKPKMGVNLVGACLQICLALYKQLPEVNFFPYASL